MTGVISFCAGMTVGLALGFVLVWWRRRDAAHVAQNIIAQHAADKNAEYQLLIGRLKESFGSLSLEALSRSSEEFLKIAGQRLNNQTEANSRELVTKKELIDQTLVTMKTELTRVSEMVQTLEKDRKAKFELLSNHLENAVSETKKLHETTTNLKAVLANTQVRGQWGERMAEDVLRLAGFVSGVNFRKQETLDDSRTRPDYTFLLPQNRVLHMDVKFPLDHYLRYLESPAESDRERHLQQFLRDVKRRIDEVTKREYINPAGNTLDYVLVFIPNEQVYVFLNEQDRTLLDYALGKKVILCSPATLYAILAVVRQAMDTFCLEQKSSEIRQIIGDFHKQWEKFAEAMDKVAKKLDDAHGAFGELCSTRRNQLERPLRQIEALRTSESEAANIVPTLRLLDSTAEAPSAKSQ